MCPFIVTGCFAWFRFERFQIESIGLKRRMKRREKIEHLFFAAERKRSGKMKETLTKRQMTLNERSGKMKETLTKRQMTLNERESKKYAFYFFLRLGIFFPVVSRLEQSTGCSTWLSNQHQNECVQKEILFVFSLLDQCRLDGCRRTPLKRRNGRFSHFSRESYWHCSVR